MNHHNRLMRLLRAGGGGVASYTITGYAYDADGTTGVVGATVALGAYSGTSGAGGAYTITGIPAGTSGSMTCTKTGYLWSAITVSAMSGNLTAQNYTNWSIVWDDFTDTATALNGTAATPLGTRTETDTNGKISTNGTSLVFETGEAANDAVWWNAVTRGYGAVLVASITTSETTNGIPTVGFDSAASGAILDSMKFAASAALQIVPNGGTAAVVGTYAAATYQIAAVMKATGIYWFIKGGAYTNWTYLYQTSAGTGNGYPAIQAGGTASVFTAEFLRAFKAGTYDVPLLAYDSFTQSDGSINGVNSDTTGPDSQTVTARAWTGANAAINTNKLVITPTVGSEMWDAGASTFDSGTYNWSAYGTNTIENDSGALKITYVDNAQGASIQLRNTKDLNSDLTVGAWYRYQFDAKVNAGNSVNWYISAANTPTSVLTNTTFQTFTGSFRASSATANIMAGGFFGAGEIMWLDNLSLKPITLSTCMASLTDASTPSVVCSANIIQDNSGSSGIVCCLDSASNPQNFILFAREGNPSNTASLVTYIGGVATDKWGYTATNYSAGARMEMHITVSGTNIVVRCYYNGALVGTEQTIADVAGALRNNTIHGLFSTTGTESFTNFALRAKTGYTGLDTYVP